MSSPYASTQFTVVPEERLFQMFALQQLPYTEELATQQFAIRFDFASCRPVVRNACISDARYPEKRGPGW